MEIDTFWCHKQQEYQSLDEFVMELPMLAKNCEFENADKEILQQVIQNCRSNQLRRRVLREPEKGNKTFLTLGRILDISERQASATETERNVNSISRSKGKLHNPSQQKPPTQNSKQEDHDGPVSLT